MWRRESGPGLLSTQKSGPGTQEPPVPWDALPPSPNQPSTSFQDMWALQGPEPWGLSGPSPPGEPHPRGTLGARDGPCRGKRASCLCLLLRTAQTMSLCLGEEREILLETQSPESGCPGLLTLGARHTPGPQAPTSHVAGAEEDV